MGNCLPLNSSDDVSLLRESEQEITTVESQHQQIHQLAATFSGIVPERLHVSRPPHMTEDEELKIAKRMGLIQHLPTGTFNGSKKCPECVICMIEFRNDDQVRFLPCMHLYHLHCIDDWLLRSLTCPSCMEPVDAALLNSYDTT